MSEKAKVGTQGSKAGDLLSLISPPEAQQRSGIIPYPAKEVGVLLLDFCANDKPDIINKLTWRLTGRHCVQ